MNLIGQSSSNLFTCHDFVKVFRSSRVYLETDMPPIAERRACVMFKADIAFYAQLLAFFVGYATVVCRR